MHNIKVILKVNRYGTEKSIALFVKFGLQSERVCHLRNESLPR